MMQACLKEDFERRLREKEGKKMVLSAAAGKTEISYLFAQLVVFFVHCCQYAGGFFGLGRLWK